MISRFKTAIQQLGLSNGVLYLLGRFLQKLSNGRWRLIRYCLVAQPIPTPPAPTCRPSATTRIDRITPEDPICAAFPRPKEVIAQRFADGHTCLVARVKGEFAGFLWYAHNDYEEDEIRCRFVLVEPEHSVWDFDVHVEPKYRMGRIFARLWDKANELLAQEEIRWSFSRISAFNPASLNAHGQLGTSQVGTMTALCLGARQVTFLPKGPYIHYCNDWARRPVVALNTSSRQGHEAWLDRSSAPKVRAKT